MTLEEGRGVDTINGCDACWQLLRVPVGQLGVSCCRHYYNVAKAIGQRPGHYWPDQFENLCNFRAHFEGTAPEIWEQTGGRVDGFICAGPFACTLSLCHAAASRARLSCCHLSDPLIFGILLLMFGGVLFSWYRRHYWWLLKFLQESRLACEGVQLCTLHQYAVPR